MRLPRRPVPGLLSVLLLLAAAPAGRSGQADPAEATDRTDFRTWFEGLPQSPQVRVWLAEVDARLEGILEELAGLNPDPRDREAVQRQLALLLDLDQAVRTAPGLALEAGSPPLELEQLLAGLEDRAREVDAHITRRLQALLRVHDWFTISGFGPEADKQGLFLLVRAGAEPEFQRAVLERLEKLAFRGETSVTHFAALHDAVSAGQGRPQRYGTQGRCAGPGVWEPLPVEAPEEELDARRRSVLLGPFAQQKASLDAACRP